jgi:uncharacterized protein GlcG (DUF336 family)
MKACLRLCALWAAAIGLVAASAQPAAAQNACAGLPSHAELKAALASASAAAPGDPNRGFGLPMWGTVVNRDGTVCAVVFTGAQVGDQWPGSRVISAQKANTANAFSLNGLALSTAQLFPLVQPGASLFGLQESNPVDVHVAYAGNAQQFGAPNDPMMLNRIGGVNVFGGGLALYKNGQIIGGLGVSGDTSCADHNIAWKTRKLLGMNVTPTNDNISYAAGAHPTCVGGETPPAP